MYRIFGKKPSFVLFYDRIVNCYELIWMRPSFRQDQQERYYIRNLVYANFESYLSLVVCTCIYIAKMFSVTFTFNLHKKSLKLLYSKHWTNITDRFLPVSCIQWRGLGCDWLWSCVHPWSVWSPRRSPGRSWSSSRPQYWGNK